MATKFNTQLITVMVDQGSSPAARSKFLADYARKGVAELIASGQASSKYKRFVDGQEGAAEDVVRPNGVIAYQFGYLGEVVTFAVEFLRARSPVKNRKYQDSFVVAVNGRPIPATMIVAESIPPDAELYIYNDQPYARKVDVQLIGTRKLTYSVPPGLFDDAARAVKGRFGNLVTVERVYTLNFPGKWITRKQRTVEYPALHIVVR